MTQLISSYDGIDDSTDWRQRGINAAETAILVALAEMKVISEQVANLGIEIEDNLRDKDAIASICTELKCAMLRLEAASRRHSHFTAELKTYGKD